MVAVITADIINSTEFPDWKKELFEYFDFFGDKTKDWNIYRGDSLQIRIPETEKVLQSALVLKAIILQIERLNIRIAIGIGDETEITDVVTQNSGSAYVNSGRLLEKSAQNLEIKTDFIQTDDGLNATFGLLNVICEQWKPAAAKCIMYKLQNPDISQNEIANLLKTTQSNVSQTLTRSHWSEIEQYLRYFNLFIQNRL